MTVHFLKLANRFLRSVARLRKLNRSCGSTNQEEKMKSFRHVPSLKFAHRCMNLSRVHYHRRRVPSSSWFILRHTIERNCFFSFSREQIRWAQLQLLHKQDSSCVRNCSSHDTPKFVWFLNALRLRKRKDTLSCCNNLYSWSLTDSVGRGKRE